MNTTSRIVLAVLAGAAALVGIAFLGFQAVLYAVNPAGDEWVCSQGEAPAGVPGAYHQCFPEGAELPAGFEWDPRGNRPLG